MTADGPAGEAVAVDVAVTLDDQLRFNDLLLASPDVRRAYRRRVVLLLLVLPVAGLAAGVLVAWVADGMPAGAAATAWADRASVARYWLALVALLAAILAVQRASRRPRLRRAVRAQLLERTGVDPADRDLTERARCTFGPDGFASVTASAEVRLPWSAVRALDETPELLVVRTGRLAGFVLPRRDLTPDQQAAVARICATHGAAKRVTGSR